ncbi:MAG TPA: hypothetical protein VEI02_14995 [Planctomycetota bacterium]|nr:hypothetical protein [Planctomycetota bacterium]
MSNTSAQKPAEVNRDEVAKEAFQVSQRRAGPPDPVNDWFEAENIVRARMEQRRADMAAAAARIISPPPETSPGEPRPVSAAAKAAALKAKQAKSAATARVETATAAPAAPRKAATRKK